PSQARAGHRGADGGGRAPASVPARRGGAAGGGRSAAAGAPAGSAPARAHAGAGDPPVARPAGRRGRGRRLHRAHLPLAGFAAPPHGGDRRGRRRGAGRPRVRERSRGCRPRRGFRPARHLSHAALRLIHVCNQEVRPMELASSDIHELLTGLAASIAGSAGRVALILIAAFILARLLRTLLGQLERVLVRAGERAGSVPAVTRARVSTLTGVVRTLAHVTLWSVVAVICLSQLGLDVR